MRGSARRPPGATVHRRMRILYLHQYFMTRAGVGGTRSYEFARRFVGRGHEVSMVTAGRSGSRRHEIDGIDVVEVGAGYSDYMRGTALAYPRRLLAFLGFALAATLKAVRLPRPDVVYATSPPLTMALPAIAASVRHRVPLVFEVRDLWPEAPIQMGALRNPLAQRLARGLERFVYRRAAHVIALSPGMRDGVVAAGVAPERVTLVPNASDLELFSPEVDGAEARERLGLGERFVCTYFGTMGEANDLAPVVEAAARMRERGEDGVAFVLHGDGKRRPQLEELARRRGADNVVFSDPIPDKGSVARLVAASDACMTIYKDVPILATCSPNKLFDTFAGGRAAIVNTEGWLKELVEENEAGVYVRANDPAELAERVAELRDDPDRVRRYGENARRLAEREFARDELAARALAVLEAAAGRS
jgi:glycosyltransferase involved in cell wall biosynthesis